MLRLIVDTNVLITACKFSVRGVPVLKLIAGTCKLIISTSVHDEVVNTGAKYLDVVIAKEMIEEGKIEVRGVESGNYDILNRYKLGKGEKGSIVLAVEMNENVDFIVTDDRLAYIVMNRMDLNAMLFLDLIVTLLERDMLTRAVANAIVKAVEPRYPEGFIYHTLKILERGSEEMAELKAVRDLIRDKYSGLKVLESPIVNELLVRGFDQKFMELYEDFTRGECSLGYLAEQLGITTWEAYELLEKKGLRTSNL